MSRKRIRIHITTEDSKRNIADIENGRIKTLDAINSTNAIRSRAIKLASKKQKENNDE